MRVYFVAKQKKDQLSMHDTIPNKRVCLYARVYVSHREDFMQWCEAIIQWRIL